MVNVMEKAELEGYCFSIKLIWGTNAIPSSQTLEQVYQTHQSLQCVELGLELVHPACSVQASLGHASNYVSPV